jgi:putative glutamine amidotransferase
MVDDKYAQAVISAAKGLPLILPQFPELLDPAKIIEGLDGLLFTGSPSNVNPTHYGGPPSPPGAELDAARDHLTLPLWRAAVEAGLPSLGICRGLQELNVAFGGTLVQRLNGAGPEHHPANGESIENQYARSHAITINPGGALSRLGLEGIIEVNSVHSQGIARVGHGLRVEAVAEDGLVEGLSVEGSQAFELAIQRHPEWQVLINADYLRIFQAFGDACRKRADQCSQVACNTVSSARSQLS